MLGQTASKLMGMAKEDEVREVVTAVFETLNYLLKNTKKHTLSLIGGTTPLIGLIKDAFQETVRIVIFSVDSNMLHVILIAVFYILFSQDLSSLWVSCTGSASDWFALQEALYKCIDTIQFPEECFM